MTKTSLSFESLNASKACDVPFEYEYIDPNGHETGLLLQVLGADSDTVRSAANALSDAHRRQEAIRSADATRPGDDITPAESLKLLGQKLAAIRLVGWKGMDRDYSPELALQLCQMNSHLADSVMTKSNKLGNFPGASPKS